MQVQTSHSSNSWTVWNPVCCHGNKTFKLVLWSTFSRVLPQRIKHFGICWDISFHHIDLIWSKFGWLYSSIGYNLHISKTWISLERKGTFENKHSIFFSHADYLFMFSVKWLRSERCDFRHSTTLSLSKNVIRYFSFP